MKPGLALVLISVFGLLQPGLADAQSVLLDPNHPEWSERAPETFDAVFETSEGDFTVSVTRAWAPRGADRFYNLVRFGYYDDARFHRTVPDFIVQFGLAGDPEVSRAWFDAYIPDDSVRVSNTRGRIAFAFTEPGTRSTQVYVSTVDNSRLDTGGFAPFGEVTVGMAVVDRLYSGYGEDSGGGLRRGDQSPILAEGNAWLDREFPELSRLNRAHVRTQRVPIDTAAVRRFVEAMMEPGQFPGAAVVIVDENGPVFLRTFGDPELTPDSRLFIGANTKTMTALAAMTLVEEGRLSLSTPVLEVLPDLVFSDPERGARLTIDDLVRHRSGLPRIAAFNRRVQERGALDHVDFFADPGAATEYSNLNYQLLGTALEAVTGRSYAELMRERIFEPAGMTRTVGDPEQAGPELAQGHTYFFGWPFARDESRVAERLVPAGYAVTTARDLGRYLRLYLDGGGDVVLPETIEAIGTPPSGETDVGLGWGVSTIHGAPALSHAGTTLGFYSKLAVLPERGLAVGVVTTRNAGPFLDAPTALFEGVVAVLHGEEPGVYVPWERILRLVVLVLVLYDVVRTVRLHREWKGLGRPRSVAHTTPVIARLLFDLTLAAAIPLWIVVGLAKLPIQAFFEFYPDLGIALALFPALAIPMAVYRSLIRSETWRRAGATAP